MDVIPAVIYLLAIHYWFLGYGYFVEGNLAKSIEYLTVAAEAESRDFPVECLNSMMVLAHIYAAADEAKALEKVLSAALKFYQIVEDDFEVKVNFGMKPWLDEAMANCQAGNLGAIVIYPFSS